MEQWRWLLGGDWSATVTVSPPVRVQMPAYRKVSRQKLKDGVVDGEERK